MSKILKSRYYQVVTVLMVLMAILGIRLFVLTVVQNEEWETAASELSIKNITTSAPRGEILDRYGRVLAGNVQAFSVKVTGTNMDSEQLNQVSLRLINLMEKNGDSYYDNFPILLENGTFVYTYDKEIQQWLAEQGYPQDYTAEQVFNELRERLEIDPEMSRFDAQIEMQSVYKVNPPISVKNMKFLKELEKEHFLGRFNLDTSLTAEQAFKELRSEKKFKIPETVSDADARKIMIVRNEISAMGYRKYMPATIAKGISDETIVQIEEQSDLYTGVEIVSETVRYYPNGTMASHILGYLGKISESEKEKYVKELGYDSNDLIGKDGIESAYEAVLKGEDGVRSVQVNAVGELVRVISETESKKGKDVYLTIDQELQKTAEEALEQALTQIQVGGTFKSEYGDYHYSKPYKNANVGAVVAIEVETGDVLTMASYPGFDPNLFAAGISNEAWASLQSKNPRNPLEPAPLYNVATKASQAPGSTFKMVTATAAMQCGLDPKKELRDGGYVTIGNTTKNCLIWTSRKTTHGKVNLRQAIEVSCNYYFYDIMMGKDYTKNTSLGYKEPISINKVMNVAAQYGLGESTGIEIPEVVKAQVTAKTKMESTKAQLRNVLIGRAEKYFKPEIAKVKDKTQLNKYIEEIVSWTEADPVLSRKEVIRRMSTVGIKEDMIETVADLCKFTYYNQATWTEADNLNISIGQGELAYTPLQIANYIATIGNGGVRNKVSLISGIEGEPKIKKEPVATVDITEANLKEIVEGMKLVATGNSGSMKSVFRGFPVQVAGKTGTAQKGGKIPPVDEVAYVQQHLRSFNPKLTWEAVEIEMNRLMEDYPDVFLSRDSAVRQAVINLSNGTVTTTKLDAFKPEFDPFAWVATMAPADDPKIAVVVLIFQGGSSTYAAPVAREVIGKYLQLDKEYEAYNLDTKIQ